MNHHNAQTWKREEVKKKTTKAPLNFPGFPGVSAVKALPAVQETQV